MEPATVLVIEEGPEATLVRAALARQPAVRVVDAPDVGRALKRLKKPARVAFAIIGAGALGKSANVRKLGTRGIPVLGVAPRLTPTARRRALAAGVREIQERPREWPRYARLIDGLVGRFIR